jgi:putative heme-binding domain-containing protein
VNAEAARPAPAIRASPGWQVLEKSRHPAEYSMVMHRAFLLPLFISAGGLAAEPDVSLVREAGPRSAEEELAGFRVPEGFRISLFAAEPMIGKPVNLAFDARGRLWVTSTHEYPYAAPRERWADELGTRVHGSRDAILILEDGDGDGRADKRTVFADGLNIPTGVLPYGDGCIAWSIPNLWHFRDTDGDGICDERRILFGPLGWERDVHGNCSSLRLAPDGWVYATHGFSNTSRFEVRPENLRGARPGDPGTVLELHSGNVFRFRPDGSRVELFSAGQVNPFGLDWDRHGNLYSADCHSAPIYQLLPGACYPSFGKPHDGLGYGPVMMHHTHSSTGICGITYLKSSTWGEAWADRILIGNVVTSRINLDRVTFRGSTPVATEEPDFLTSEDPWFRPVDLRMGPDRALYVADFYNRIIGHYEVPLEHPGRDRERGRIWRIAKKDVPPEAAAAPDEVAALRFAARAGTPDAALVERAAAWLLDGDPFQQRAATETLMAAGAVRHLPRMLATLAATPAGDEALRHQLRLAIRTLLRQPGGFAALGDAEGEELLAIARATGTDEAALWLFARMQDHAPTPDELRPLAGRVPLAELIAHAKREPDPQAQAALLFAIADALQERGELPGPPLIAWGSRIAEELLEKVAARAWELVPDARSPEPPWCVQRRPSAEGGEVEVISSLHGGGAGPEGRTGSLRSAPFAAPAELSFLLCGHRGAPDQPAHERNHVRLIDAATGEELRRAYPPRNDTAQRITWDLSALTDRQVRFEITDGDTGEAYAWLAAGDFRPALISTAAFSPATTPLARLAVLLKASASAGLRDRLAAFLPPSPPPPPTAVTAEMQAALDDLVAARAASFSQATPDVGRGARVYASHCAHCHAIGGEGRLVGPQLDGIGHRGAARLIEDIVDPGKNVDAHFRLHVITRKDGSTFAGLIRGEVGEVVVAVDAAGVEHRISRAEIASDEETGLSLMPPAFGQAIPEAELHDLVAWLMQFETDVTPR